jgi:hypothetical protein
MIYLQLKTSNWCWIWCFTFEVGFVFWRFLLRNIDIENLISIIISKTTLWNICELKKATIHIKIKLEFNQDQTYLKPNLYSGEVCELVNVWSSYLCTCVCEVSNASEFSPCGVVNLWNSLGRAFICLRCVGGLKLYLKLSKLFSFLKHEIFLGLL